MSDKQYMNSLWFEESSMRALQFVRGGYRESGVRIDKVDITLDFDEVHLLIDFLFKNGWIKPQLGENREEDLKIIHRLIDLTEKK